MVGSNVDNQKSCITMIQTPFVFKNQYFLKFCSFYKVLHVLQTISFVTKLNLSIIIHKNNETNYKFYWKVAFIMYMEMVSFRPKS